MSSLCSSSGWSLNASGTSFSNESVIGWPERILISRVASRFDESLLFKSTIGFISLDKTIKEIAPEAKCHYMNTVKSRESIKEAYFNYGIRSFSLDTKDELIKILDSTNKAKDSSCLWEYLFQMSMQR